MKDPLDVSPSKRNQGTTRGKENIPLTSVGIEPTTSGVDLLLLTVDLIRRSGVLFPPRSKEFGYCVFSCLEVA